MDVHAARGGDKALRRIAALLVSLAVLAERAAGRSFPVRCLVLWLLRRAETVAEDYVFEWTGTPPSAIAGIAAAGYGPADALRLAARFRVFAAALRTLLLSGGLVDDRHGRIGGAAANVAQCPGGPSVALGGWRRKPNDTS